MSKSPWVQHYLSEFARHESHLPGNGLPWIREIRQQALAHFTQQGIPSVREEAWKYSRLTLIEQTPFTWAQRAPYIDREEIEPILSEWSVLSPHFLVLVDGHFYPELSQLPSLPASAFLSSFEEAVCSQHPIIKELLADRAFGTHPFYALNTALMSGGVCFYLPPKAKLEHPLHLISITMQPAKITTPRHVMILDQDARMDLIETHVGISSAAYFNNAVTHLVLKKNAELLHTKIQQEGTQAAHWAMHRVHQSTGSQYTATHFAFGGQFSRQEVHLNLAERQAQCRLQGLSVSQEKQYRDHTAVITHQQPQTQSHTFYQGVASGESRTVFNGKIVVQAEAKKATARLTNRNLLLSTQAEMNTRPQLEIYTDDIQCSHGATVGQLDHEALFYLRSRGVEEKQAKQLLIQAFFEQIVKQLSHPALREKLRILLGQGAVCS